MPIDVYAPRKQDEVEVIAGSHRLKMMLALTGQAVTMDVRSGRTVHITVDRASASGPDTNKHSIFSRPRKRAGWL